MSTESFDKNFVIRGKEASDRFREILNAPLPKERIRALPRQSETEEKENLELLISAIRNQAFRRQQVRDCIISADSTLRIEQPE